MVDSHSKDSHSPASTQASHFQRMVIPYPLPDSNGIRRMTWPLDRCARVEFCQEVSWTQANSNIISSYQSHQTTMFFQARRAVWHNWYRHPFHCNHEDGPAPNCHAKDGLGRRSPWQPQKSMGFTLPNDEWDQRHPISTCNRPKQCREPRHPNTRFWWCQRRYLVCCHLCTIQTQKRIVFLSTHLRKITHIWRTNSTKRRLYFRFTLLLSHDTIHWFTEKIWSLTLAPEDALQLIPSINNLNGSMGTIGWSYRHQTFQLYQRMTLPWLLKNVKWLKRSVNQK